MTLPDPSRYADGRMDRPTRRAFDPDPPTHGEWKRVSDGIAARVLPARRGTARWVRPAVAILAVAAAALVGLVLWGDVGRRPLARPASPEVANAGPQPAPETDPLAEFDVLPIASDDELRIAIVRGDWGNGLVIGVHPLPGELRLATADELTIERAPDGMETVPDFGDLPALLSLKAKRTDE